MQGKKWVQEKARVQEKEEPGRAGGRPSRYLPVRYVGQAQKAALAAIVQTYARDLDDPAAREVLLVLEEICRLLAMPGWERDALFGPRVLAALAPWRAAPPTFSAPRPAHLQRAWLWLPNRPTPQLCRLDEQGRVVVAPVRVEA